MTKELKKFVKTYHIRTRKGKLVLYKAVTREYGSLYVIDNCFENLDTVRGGANVYLPGTEVKVRDDDIDRDPGVVCGKGLHVGTLECAKFFANCVFFNYSTNRRIVEVIVDPKDVICVPDASIDINVVDNKSVTLYPKISLQKIRCRRLIVVRELERRN